MKPRQIACRTCQHQWRGELDYSIYSQQAIESCPCPSCGAYTLTCTEAIDRQGIEELKDHKSGSKFLRSPPVGSV